MGINGRMKLQNDDMALEKRIVGEHTVLLKWCCYGIDCIDKV